MEVQEIEVVDVFEKSFTVKDRLFRYRFTSLEIEQAELCRAVGELRNHQINSPATTLNETLKSQSAEAICFLSAFLFKEVINGEAKPFNRSYAETEMVKIIKTLPITGWEILEVSIRDFFTNIGLGLIGSQLFQRERKRSEIETLQLLTTLASMSKNSEVSDTQES
jgi:hypothetical protein